MQLGQEGPLYILIPKNILHLPVFLSLKINLVLANSADHDEMLQCAAFHMGLHGLPKYLF